MSKALDVHVLKSHTASINSVSFFDDDSKFVSGSDDYNIIGWDVASHSSIFKLKGHEAPVKSCTSAKSGCKILSGSWDRTVRLWDGQSTNCLWTLQHDSVVMHVSFCEETSLIAVACDNKITKIWDIRNFEDVMTLTGHENSVTCCSQNNFTLATGSLDKTIRVNDLRNGNTLLHLDGHTSAISSVDLSSDGFKLCSASWDKTVRVWDIHSGTYRTHGPHVMYEHEGCVSTCKFVAGNQKIISAGYDKVIVMWDAMSTKKLHQIRAHGSWINDVAMTDDSKWLVSCSKDRTIRMWNIENADRLPIVLHNKLEMGYKYQECEACQRTFKVEERDMIEVGEELTKCVYCRLPSRSYQNFADAENFGDFTEQSSSAEVFASESVAPEQLTVV